MNKNKVKIGGVWVDVKYVEGIDHFTEGDMGISFFTKHLIKIDSSLPKTEQESTLLHEIIEFVNKMYELNLEHKTICCLEVALYQVLKDNFNIKF